MATELSKRQRHILRALQNLGGTPTTSQIAREAEKTFGSRLHNNGVSQTLASLEPKGLVAWTGERSGREWTWRLLEPNWEPGEGQLL